MSVTIAPPRAQTTREGMPPGRLPEVRRTLRGVRADDALPLVGGLLGGVALASVIFFVIAPFSGLLGFVVVAYGGFLATYALLVAMDGDRELVKDRISAILAWSCGLAMATGLGSVLVFVVIKAWAVIFRENFYREDMSTAGPLDPLTEGGVAHAIAGTLIMIGIALAITIPLGVLCALFLSETRGPFTRFVRTVVEAMTALPSVVAGLFVYAAIIMLRERFGVGGPSGLAAAVALSVMMLPIIVRAADVVLRLVPGNLKEAAAALGAPRWRVIWHVTLPTARSGLMTAIILGTARGIGETSPVLLTAGYTTGFNVDPIEGPMVSLPLLTFSMTRSPEETYIQRGFGAAFVLMVLVFVLFVLARLIGGRAPGDLSKRQRRRRARRSAEDLRYYELLAESDARRSPALQAPSTPAPTPAPPSQEESR